MKQVGERIEIFRGEAEVGVATPAFGELEASAPVTDLAAHALHFVKSCGDWVRMMSGWMRRMIAATLAREGAS